MSNVKLFISHSHKDQEIASRLVRIIDESLEVPANAIRCSSAPGYQLALGDLTGTQLRNELDSADAIVAILSPRSIEADWVLFELGAAWGLVRRTIPLLVGGLEHDDLPGPLRGTLGGQMADANVLEQLVEQIGERQHWPRRNTPRGQESMRELVTYLNNAAYVSSRLPDSLKKELHQSYSNKRDKIGPTQNELLLFITEECLQHQAVTQRRVSEQFRGTSGLYYRLEQLWLLGFLEKSQIGGRGGVPEYTYSLTENYRRTQRR